jgi:hypothetical protein
MMAHGSRMIDWEDLAQRQIVEIQRALPESIRARATEVPVFFSRARNGKGGTCLARRFRRVFPDGGAAGSA